ncbi:GNAT family N-acetyltransferase [Candidatus Poribacteria bacterium]|jgi:RimJ/RimL family protein N-acetyltransferase|nr:GNAT family N-acetyltransferase [Candidatus Poribacteria bacterium]MBT5536115.1 GNAT family N-acetyltransferase [Candidatus Poribacteria bacterium]MBT5710703.1 GNAT family N-acetyltransferase [Candidatus Poribacteria bacterium]MBT7804536.1 GNAT family N-acetyltransferase [Candidatus Poribacteria bacterium]
MIDLRPFTRDDFDRLIGWAVSPELVVQWAGFGFTYPLDHAQLHTYIRYAEDGPDSRVIWTVVESDTGEAVGHIELDRIHAGARRARLSRVIVAPECRGQGIAGKMTLLVLQHGFDVLGLHRIDLGVFDFNATAIRCYEACGFVREGLERDSIRMGDGYWSAVQMSILEHEWRALAGSRREGSG